MTPQPTDAVGETGARVELTVTYNDGQVYLAETTSNGGISDAADLLERVAGVAVGALRSVSDLEVSE